MLFSSIIFASETLLKISEILEERKPASIVGMYF